MKARLTFNGYLTITPETELETYALKMWQESAKRDGEAYRIHVDPLTHTPPSEDSSCSPK